MAFESLGKKIAQLGQDTMNSVQKMSESYQINSRLNDEKRALEKMYAQIGQALVERFKDNVPEGFEDQFEALSTVKEAIADLEEQLQKNKGVVTCPSCGREAQKGERYCSACGTKLPEDFSELAEKLKANMTDAGNEVGDLVNEAADKAKDFFSDLASRADAFMKNPSAKEETPVDAPYEQCGNDQAADGQADGASAKAEPQGTGASEEQAVPVVEKLADENYSAEADSRAADGCSKHAAGEEAVENLADDRNE